MIFQKFRQYWNGKLSGVWRTVKMLKWKSPPQNRFEVSLTVGSSAGCAIVSCSCCVRPG